MDMDVEKLAVLLQETTDRTLRNEGRIKKLETEHQILHELTTSIAVMAEQIKGMNSNIKNLTTKVDQLESNPRKRWEGILDKVIWAVLAAVIAFVLGKFGL